MKKFLYWIFVCNLVIIRKIFGSPLFPLYWIAVYFRKYSRNTVYSYHLRNKKFLKRLEERNPIETTPGVFALHSKHPQKKVNGIVHTREVPKLEYFLVVVFLWGWIDDDSNEDTYDKGFIKTIINNQRMTWLPKICKNKLKINKIKTIKGNSFDLGDLRNENPLFNWCAALLWTNRNTAYNFNYLFHEISDNNLVWSFIYKNHLIGWRKGTIVNNVQTWNFECFYKIN